MRIKAIIYGLVSSVILLTVYFIVLTFVSGFNYALGQFFTYWYFIIALVIGFGIQIALYSYISGKVQKRSKGVLAATGTTSTAAMISCCSHYLVNLVPILGITGLITIVAQYQIQIFWIGITFNILGILYMLNRLRGLRMANTV